MRAKVADMEAKATRHAAYDSDSVIRTKKSPMHRNFVVLARRLERESGILGEMNTCGGILITLLSVFCLFEHSLECALILSLPRL